jgi:hypothetical protein
MGLLLEPWTYHHLGRRDVESMFVLIIGHKLRGLLQTEFIILFNSREYTQMYLSSCAGARRRKWVGKLSDRTTSLSSFSFLFHHNCISNSPKFYSIHNMRAFFRLLATTSSSPGRPVPLNVLPPIPLYRRLLRAHRKLPGDMRVLGDEYIKTEFRAHRDVENPLHIVGLMISVITGARVLTKRGDRLLDTMAVIRSEN